MAYLTDKFLGKYRLKAEIDLSTNDFPREAGTDRLEQNDIYIVCQKGGKIYHYGRNVLVCYVPSLGRGRNILKKIAENQGMVLEKYYEGSEKQRLFDYDRFYKDLLNHEIIFDIEETDEEVLWKFKYKNESSVIPYMQPLTNGASISPFSTRNLPTKKYVISEDDLAVYKEITNNSNKDILFIAQITRGFISDYIPSKYHQYKGVNMNKLMKKECLKGKEFIHSLGLWSDFIKYIEDKIKEG